MNKNRELHELLGKCWHEPDGALNHIETGEKSFHCGKCDAWYTGNPDYAADPRLVLEAMKERGDWQAFGNYALLISTIGLNGAFTFAVPVDFILDRTGKLRDLAIEFLRKGK